MMFIQQLNKARMGYRPHLLARGLSKGRTMTIGLIVFDLYNRFFAQLANAIESNARKEGYFVYLALTNKNANLYAQEQRLNGFLDALKEDSSFMEPLIIDNNTFVHPFPLLHIHWRNWVKRQ